ncbi:TetR/AcrR family transcriptional regulator [Acholeplasma hippikon]|uniref:DNA-binding transcriptional repressor AcrR n=1 Tax=Acholeplasma hippikon TaxID=264636 RepID=A0A449BK05_9MOLU|nr:TetR/AcrR family transcriptional regulator [Acholeplasma hippikon]VEU82723.1 DNA-binding transcriptional repressor AcrR [Acholeplasma hippikon]
MENSSITLPKTKTGYKSFNKIIEVSKKLFASNGYSSTSINEIIAQAEIATGTFYNYFEDKKAVYIYLLQDYGQKIKQRTREVLENSNTRYEIERAGLKAFIKFTIEDPLSYKIIWESLFVDEHLFESYYKDFSISYMKQLAKSQIKNEVDQDIDLETLSYVLMGIANFIGLQVQFKHNATDHDIERIIDNVMYILKNGMFGKK